MIFDCSPFFIVQNYKAVFETFVAEISKLFLKKNFGMRTTKTLLIILKQSSFLQINSNPLVP